MFHSRLRPARVFGSERPALRVIIASSFRPFDKCSPEIADNQVRAKLSWDKCAERVVYLNHPEPRLSGPHTVFIPTDGKPDIKSMAILLGSQPDWGCIANADIVLGSGIRRLLETLTLCEANCAVSKRYTLPEGGDTSKATLVEADYGVDFFVAKPEVWRHVARKIPKDFKLGRIVWDTWLVCFFVTEYFWSCYDATPSRVVFHPKHGDREDQALKVPKDPYLSKSLWPPFTTPPLVLD